MSKRSDSGPSYVTFNPPDTVFIVWIGDVDEAEMERVVEATSVVSGAPPTLFLIADVSRMGSVTGGARRAAAEGSKRTNVRGSAVLGASFAARVIITLTDKIQGVLGASDCPTRYFATEVEARAWIAERRATIGAALGPRKPPERRAGLSS